MAKQESTERYSPPMEQILADGDRLRDRALRTGAYSPRGLRRMIRDCVRAGREVGDLSERRLLWGLVQSYTANLHSITGKWRAIPSILPYEFRSNR